MDRSSDHELTIPVTEEQLEVSRKTVDTGHTLRLRKQVEEVSAPVREALSMETVKVERVPLGRAVDEAPPVRQEGDVTVIPVVEERLVMRKELVLVEEIRVTRLREWVQAEADVPLRRERVFAERFDPHTGQWHPEPGAQDETATKDRN